MVVPGIVAGLLAMGLLQWLVLRPVGSRPGRWVPVTSGAWLAGVILPVVALSLVPNQWPLVMHAIVGIAAAVAMGALVGSLTAGTLARLASQQPEDDPGGRGRALT